MVGKFICVRKLLSFNQTFFGSSCLQNEHLYTKSNIHFVKELPKKV